MFKYLITIFTLISGISMHLFSQENTWSLEDCIKYAMENNITIKQGELNTLYNENTYDQSKAGRIPSLNAGAQYNYDVGRALDQTTYSYGDKNHSFYPYLGSRVNLFSGFQTKNTIEQNHLNLLASYEDVEKIKNDISLSIAAAYLQILFSKELLNVAENQLEVTAQQVERTEKMVEAGKVARGSALEIQAQYAAEELNRVNAQNQLALSMLNLQQLLDLQYEEEFDILVPELSTPEESMLMLSLQEIYEHAEGNMPQIKAAELNLNSSEKGIKIAEGGRYPSLTLSADISSRYSSLSQKLVGIDPVTMEAQYEEYPMLQQLDDFQNFGLGLQLSIPIFNGKQVKTSISNARINMESKELELQNTKNNLYRDIQQAYFDALAALNKYKSTQKALVSMEESFKYTEKKYEVGLVNTVDYNTSKNQLIATKSDLLQAKYDFIFKTKILHFYKGESITL